MSTTRQITSSAVDDANSMVNIQGPCSVGIENLDPD